MMQINQYRYKHNRDFYRSLLKLAIPMGLSALLQALLNMTDTLMITKLSVEAIAAVGTANKLFFLLMLSLFGVYSGLGAFISQFWGKEDLKQLQTVYFIALIVGLAISFVFSIIAIFLPEQFVNFFVDDSEVIKLGGQYLRIIGFSYLVSSFIFGFEMVSRSTENAILPTIIAIIGIVFNIGLNFLFIFGNESLGIRALGVQGAALGTLIARSIQLLCYITYILITKDRVLWIKRSSINIEKTLVKKLISKAAPVLANEFIWSLGITFTFMAYGRLGVNAIASVQLFDTLFSLLTVFTWGIANSSTVMLGKALGEKNIEKARWYSKLFIFTAIIMGIVTSILILASIPLIDYVYNTSNFFKTLSSGDVENFEIVITNLKRLLFTVSFYMPFKLLAAVFIVGILRSGGDTVFALFTEFFGLWVYAVPIAFVLVKVTNNIGVVFMFVTFEEVIKDVICLIRYKSGKYIHNLVHEDDYLEHEDTNSNELNYV
ncbi:MATE family efflux transporter [Haloplasma contractile]|uniref:Probable multidrug resistance protein NorM n=1 Tax=Haloplasma contractile SSD-17B TaxID=1033810 RepID=U2FLZ8_9MOLU|nr:MATE family efflux transporter [Haloplasma contractile]ERJ13760.1 putative cation efflux pump Multidrug resistance protein [Haloplasma contractile SSD-17B]